MKKCVYLAVVLCCAIGCMTITAMAEKSEEEWAQETIAYCEETSSTKPTPEMVQQKVNEACALIESEGEAALPKFKGNGSDFIFAGTYIWINDVDGMMVMHPIKYKLNGRIFWGLKMPMANAFLRPLLKPARIRERDGLIIYGPSRAKKRHHKKYHL